jgi:DNA polymerase I-like protein with 3'-5' exonuclease and polymerase domains
LSQDKAILDLFNHGCGDMHSLVAKMTYKDQIGDCPVEEIKAKFKGLRQDAKGVEFAINYGGDANTIKTRKKIPLSEAQKIYDDYMKGFPGVKAYQDYQRKFVMSHGYIILNDKTRHKAFIYDFDNLQNIQSQFNGDYWATYNAYKQSNPNSAIVEEVKHYFRRKSASEKQAINYKCQGTGAIMFKLASIYLYQYLLDNNLLFKVKLCIPAHDE